MGWTWVGRGQAIGVNRRERGTYVILLKIKIKKRKWGREEPRMCSPTSNSESSVIKNMISHL